ncbi:MAG: hypothetical protein ABIQ52_15210 [Vicinamibacterales bacterium]
MNVSRASFLKTCGLVMLGRTADAAPLLAAIGVAPTPALLGPAHAFLLEEASAALFRPHLHSAFRVRSSGQPSCSLVLAQVTEGPRTGDLDQFSLTFKPAVAAPALEAMQTFQHPVLGTFDLFIAPVGSARAGVPIYEACFSRHRTARDRPCR